jgi:hypothetical protein
LDVEVFFYLILLAGYALFFISFSNMSFAARFCSQGRSVACPSATRRVLHQANPNSTYNLTSRAFSSSGRR